MQPRDQPRQVRGYAGKRPTRSVTSARISLAVAWSGSPSVWVTALAMRSAMTTISSVPMPWVVTDGVPTRMPEAVFGGCGSKGCLLYTSDAADDLTRVDLGGRRIIK